MEILTVLFGLLGVIVLGIIIVAFKKRQFIFQTLNATLALKQVQKNLEKELYNKEMAKQIPDMVKAKVAKDIEKKLNKKSFVEKLAAASKELTKNTKEGGMEHKGLDSVMSDLNVFSNNNKNELKNTDFLGGKSSVFSKATDESKEDKRSSISDAISNTSIDDLLQAKEDTDNSDDDIGDKKRQKRKR